MSTPKPSSSKTSKDAALHAKLTFAEERTASWRNKAAAENHRANEAERLLAELRVKNETLDRELVSATEHLGEAVEKIGIRDEALVQMALRIAPYGDPASAR